MDFSNTIAFINPKSGGKHGSKVYEKLCLILGLDHVFDLSWEGPETGLRKYRKQENLRVIACGGDGTVGWVHSCIDKIKFDAPPAVVPFPLGTGNDMSRVLGWGANYSGEAIVPILEAIEGGIPIPMDRWNVSSDVLGPDDYLAVSDLLLRANKSYADDFEMSSSASDIDSFSSESYQASPPRRVLSSSGTVSSKKSISKKASKMNTEAYGEMFEMEESIHASVMDSSESPPASLDPNTLSSARTYSKSSLASSQDAITSTSPISIGSLPSTATPPPHWLSQRRLRFMSASEIPARSTTYSEKRKKTKESNSDVASDAQSASTSDSMSSNTDVATTSSTSGAASKKRHKNTHTDDASLSGASTTRGALSSDPTSTATYEPSPKSTRRKKKTTLFSDSPMSPHQSLLDETSSTASTTNSEISEHEELSPKSKRRKQKKLSNSTSDIHHNTSPPSPISKRANSSTDFGEPLLTKRVQRESPAPSEISDLSGTMAPTVPILLLNDENQEVISLEVTPPVGDNSVHLVGKLNGPSILLEQLTVPENRLEADSKSHNSGDQSTKSETEELTDLTDPSPALRQPTASKRNSSKRHKLITASAPSSEQKIRKRKSQRKSDKKDTSTIVSQVVEDAESVEGEGSETYFSSDVETLMMETSELSVSPGLVNTNELFSPPKRRMDSSPSVKTNLIEEERTGARTRPNEFPSTMMRTESEPVNVLSSHSVVQLSLPASPIPGSPVIGLKREPNLNLLEPTSSMSSSAKRSAEVKTLVMNNYFSIGVDSMVALEFHVRREAMPNLFPHHVINKAWYGIYGIKHALVNLTKKPDLRRVLKLELDGVEVEIPKGVEALIFLQIPSYSSGTNLWGDYNKKKGQRTPPSVCDGIFEVVATKGVMHLGALQVGWSSGIRLGQAHSAVMYNITTVPVQCDGEPWLLPPCKTTIDFRSQSTMLFNINSGVKRFKTVTGMPPPSMIDPAQLEPENLASSSNLSADAQSLPAPSNNTVPAPLTAADLRAHILRPNPITSLHTLNKSFDDIPPRIRSSRQSVTSADSPFLPKTPTPTPTPN